MAENELPLNLNDIDVTKISCEEISESVDNKKIIDIRDEIKPKEEVFNGYKQVYEEDTKVNNIKIEEHESNPVVRLLDEILEDFVWPAEQQAPNFHRMRWRFSNSRVSILVHAPF